MSIPKQPPNIDSIKNCLVSNTISSVIRNLPGEVLHNNRKVTLVVYDNYLSILTGASATAIDTPNS